MKIVVLGMGYVGCVSAACLADLGHNVIGVDISSTKIEQLKKGKSPLAEKDLNALLAKGINKGMLSFNTSSIYWNSPREDIDAYLISVGTPNNSDGTLNLSGVFELLKVISSRANKRVTVIIRSTLDFNGVSKLNELSGDKGNLEIIFNPEFLREGSAIADFMNPPQIVFGTPFGEKSNLSHALTELYEGIVSKTSIVSYAEAIAMKLTSNTWHALKVAFTNEIAMWCADHQIDSDEVMSLVRNDKVLNISSAYMKPGFAYGGSCLPKDSRAIANGVTRELPLIQSLEYSNKKRIEYFRDRILNEDVETIVLIGLAFKKGTDDLRYSPYLELIRQLLIIKPYLKISFYDPMIRPSYLVGYNLEIYNSFLKDTAIDQLMEFDNVDADLLILGHSYESLILPVESRIFELK